MILHRSKWPAVTERFLIELLLRAEKIEVIDN